MISALGHGPPSVMKRATVRGIAAIAVEALRHVADDEPRLRRLTSASGFSSPSSMRTSVVLPAPLGPISVTISPAPISSVDAIENTAPAAREGRPSPAISASARRRAAVLVACWSWSWWCPWAGDDRRGGAAGARGGYRPIAHRPACSDLSSSHTLPAEPPAIADHLDHGPGGTNPPRCRRIAMPAKTAAPATSVTAPHRSQANTTCRLCRHPRVTGKEGVAAFQAMHETRPRPGIQRRDRPRSVPAG